MTNREIYEWLCASPLLKNEKLNLDYLPTYEGWSMTMPRRRTDTDILGNAWESVEINITRRKSISGNEDRLAIADELDNLRFWQSKTRRTAAESSWRASRSRKVAVHREQRTLYYL